MKAMTTCLAITLGIVALAACQHRPATHMPRGYIVATKVEPVDEEAYELMTVTTAPAYAPEKQVAPPFDTRAAREAFARTDVSACALEEDGHAKVTFAPDGTVMRVVVDHPYDLATASRDCVGGALSQVRIAAFAGNAITIGTTVRAAR